MSVQIPSNVIHLQNCSRLTIPSELMEDRDMLGGIDPADCSDENRSRAKAQLTPLAHFLATRQELLCALQITNKQQKGSAARIGYADEFIEDYKEL